MRCVVCTHAQTHTHRHMRTAIHTQAHTHPYAHTHVIIERPDLNLSKRDHGIERNLCTQTDRHSCCIQMC